MKVISEPIHVEIKKGWPMRIHRNKQVLTVTRLIDCWVAQGRWWASEEKRIYFQLETRSGAIGIYQSGSQWTLARIFD